MLEVSPMEGVAMFQTIVVGHDGTSNGDPALATARSLAEEGSRLVVVHIVEVLTGKGGGYPLHADEQEARAALEAQVSEMKAAGIEVELVVHDTQLGGPARLIAAEAEHSNADLIVVGSRGQSALAQVVLGSVPLRLMHLAHCPVMVVPSPAAS